MKKLLLPLFFIATIAVSCSKDDDNPIIPAESYMNMTAGSARTYTFTDNQDPANNSTTTQTSTNRDTTIGTRSYHIFSSSDGSLEYYNVSGNDYYQFTDAGGIGLGAVENLYLKNNAPVGTSWSQNYNFDLSGTAVDLTVNNVINAVGLTKTVNGTSYTNVIEVKTTFTASSSGFPIPMTSDIRSFYAPKFGLIENTVNVDIPLASMTIDTKTILTSAVFP